MAVTFTVTPRRVFANGDRKEAIYDVAATGTPTVGGDTITAATLGMELELDLVDCTGCASVAGGTSGTAVAIIHPQTASVSSVTVLFYVQGTAAAGTSMVAYTGATAGFTFRMRALGKGSISAPT